MIKLQVIGNLGKDCITNQVNGKNVMNFNVAHTEKFKDSTGNMKEKTTWVECAYWSDRTALAPYLRKGTQVFVEGTPEVRQYTKNDGTQGASLSLRISTVQLLGQKGDGNGQEASTGGGYSQGYQQPQQPNTYKETAAATQPMPEPVDDLPF
jgi:single-strand DNA-binding protein